MTTHLLAINYHSEPDTLRFAEDLLAQEEASFLLAIVDNTAHLRPAPALAALPARDPRIRYLVPGDNLGYFGAAAWGRRQLTAEGEPEWTIVTNTDIRIPDRRFLQRLERVSGVGVLAPCIRSGLSGRDQNPFRSTRPSAAQMRRYQRIFAHYWGLVAYELAARVKKRLQRSTTGTAHPPGPIYAPHGAFIPIHRSYFEAGGTLDHGTFLFNEEFLVAETARRLGLEIRYDPSFEVLHAEHATTSIFASRVIAKHVAAAAAHTADTWFREDGR
jgi:GT2 family glycosyltransferase